MARSIFLYPFCTSLCLVLLIFTHLIDSTPISGGRNIGDIDRTPVIFVPGDGGNQLYALKTTYSIEPCDYFGNTAYSVLWIDLIYPFKEAYDCFQQRMRLGYNRTTHKTYVWHKNFETKIEGWGSTRTMSRLDGGRLGSRYKIVYLEKTIDYFKQFGYTDKKDLRGAPYDFRRAPNDNVDFVPKFKALIEETFTINNKKRVMLMGHSLGNLYILHFLQRMPKTWKKKFVRGFVAVSPPFGGSVKSVKAVTHGYNPGFPSAPISAFMKMQRSFPSSYFLFPSPHLWRPNEVLVHRPGKNYTVQNYHELFMDIKSPDSWSMYKDVSHLVAPFNKPDVDEIFCIYGRGVPTLEKLVWKNGSFPNSKPIELYGEGDGTVNLRSLEVCKHWAGATTFELKYVQHEKILQHDAFFNVLPYIFTFY